ncbi:hypothetical protein [Methylocapsa acidiphila]|uniref:amino acid kinase family protein n=1 Tax=Methylocapsa acidiphila TaxID=133552 RepID=UPI00041D02CF|nr:hypothetical protein [Methylocapsa acidiphila]
MSLTVVKFGGSLLKSPYRAAWLAALAAWGGPLVLVPGGGLFADGVRNAQNAIGFDDASAHRMALLAMEQFAIALGAHSDAFVLAGSRPEFETALKVGKIPIWLPSQMALADPTLPSTWEMSSDSLAAWLAETCGADRLLLIKSCDLTPPLSARELAEDQIVDPLFPRFAARSRAEVWLAGPASLAGAVETLRNGGMPGANVSLS